MNLIEGEFYRVYLSDEYREEKGFNKILKLVQIDHGLYFDLWPDQPGSKPQGIISGRVGEHCDRKNYPEYYL